ncbi:MarR family transcriptional regulator [Streptomyces sp. NPDC006743]|uniref:MarR family winged helix-turn-helix transcriptional regulator n=1 Tax=Streptomyces sp. NPDC006743 TaxID=3154480 RepID=UPI003451F79B
MPQSEQSGPRSEESESQPRSGPDAVRAAALDRLTRAAYRLSAADARLRGRATRTPGALSLTHARALRVLAEQGPLTIRGLAEGTETTGAATTQLVNGLVAAGYVTRTRGRDDKRSVLVTLTAAGRARHDQRQQALTEALHSALAACNAPALESAAEVLDHLSAIYDRL